MSTPRTVVIWNAKAGSARRAADLRARLESRAETRVFESSSAEEAQQVVADACHSGVELIVAAGGDGTINTVVNAMPRRQPGVRLAVLPVGTANDWCWSLGVPDDLTQAANLLDSGETRRLDLAEMHAESCRFAFANVATGGNSQRVTDLLTDEMKQRWGALCYLRGAVEVVSDLKSFNVRIELDSGEVESHAVWNMIVANGRTAAGRMQVASRADMEDGLLDVIIIPEGDLIDLAKLAANFALADYTELEQVAYRRVRSFTIRSAPELQFSLDGNLIEQPPRAFRVLPQALQVVVGPDYAARRGPGE